MRKIFISFLIIFFILTPTISFAEYVKKDHTTYFGTTDKELTIAWDSPPDTSYVTNYELRLYHVEREVYISLGMVGVNTLRKTITLPRSGHFIVYMRSVNINAIDETKKYSEWADSSNIKYGMVDGVKKTWWLYGHVAKPGGIIFGFTPNEEGN